MRKLIMVIIIFMAGHYYGDVAISAAKDAYTVVAKELSERGAKK
jgi:hypothetical protein